MHAAGGFVVALAFVSGLLAWGRGGIGTVLWQVGGTEAVLLLWIFSGSTFAGAMLAGGVMALARPDPEPPKGRRRLMAARVAICARRAT